MGTISVPAAIGLAATVLAAGVSAYGSIQSSNASSASSQYQAQVSANNAKIADQNAEYAKAAGERQVNQQQFKTAALVGSIKAQQASEGLDVNSGSNLDVQSSAKELGELDAITVRNAAARQAYGYQAQSMSDVAQGQLQEAKASSDSTAGLFGATSSVLGGVSSSANTYAKFLQASGPQPGKLGSDY